MSLQETYNQVKGVIATNLTSMGVEASSSDGLTTLAGKILDIEPSVSGLQLDTSMLLSSSSSSISVFESVTLTATLNATYNDTTVVDVDLKGVLQNATIKYYNGNTLLGSSTTNSDGIATYTYTPTTSGTKSIKAVFDGTDNYDDCESSAVSITVAKVTPTLSATGSSATVMVGNSLTISGSLTYSNTNIGSATINIYNASDDSLVTTATTDSSGVYSVSISYPDNQSLGSHTYYAKYNGNNAYNTVSSSNVSVTVIEQYGVGSINLSSTKDILSYADSESATITATVYDDSASQLPMEGQTVTFSDGTNTSTQTTDSNGEATFTYTSSGAGDVTITASCSFVSEIYGISDCLLYAPTEQYSSGSSNSNSHKNLKSGFTLSNNIDWEVSCDLKVDHSFLCLTDWENAETSSASTVTRYIGIGANSDTPQKKLGALGFNPSITDGILWNTSGGNYGNDYANVKITKVGNKYTFYYNNTEIANTTSITMSNYSPLGIYLRYSYSSASGYVKNLKVKPL